MTSPDASLMSAAAFLGHKPLVQRFLSKGNDPTHHDYLFPAAIEAAAFAGDKEMLQLLQESLPDGVSPSPPGTPFSQHYALNRIDFKGKADPQAILGAAMNGSIDILQVALHPPSKTVNSIASSGGDLVQGLGYALISSFDAQWDSEAHTRFVGYLFSTILHYADNWPVYQKLAPFAPEQAKELFKVGKYADYGRLDMVQALLDAGSPYEREAMNSDSPLFNAARRGFNDIVQLLLARGADVNKSQHRQGTPLRGAVIGANLSTVQILLDHGAVCDERVLLDAMLGEYMALAELILDHCTSEELHHEEFGFKAAGVVAEAGLTSMLNLMENRECFIYRDGEMVPWSKEEACHLE
ncbi:unnamed protein product [Clonostachys byssicola]|uniref:Uncharacterized protein n=1 Tax=Clonostachys byssicola TaxID=160290 RepID=A0A9N9U2H3_9HYPO|nr:unnamed protein product [Clonostachys byssicola]